ncbi:hypothetical protein BJX61DRAFT_505368 [Aspergillus egyptiacus]|nr:hypothetical protein BJX61DRAFT_505368 [Aspergillus egyptiacus]
MGKWWSMDRRGRSLTSLLDAITICRLLLLPQQTNVVRSPVRLLQIRFKTVDPATDRPRLLLGQSAHLRAVFWRASPKAKAQGFGELASSMKLSSIRGKSSLPGLLPSDPMRRRSLCPASAISCNGTVSWLCLRSQAFRNQHRQLAPIQG